MSNTDIDADFDPFENDPLNKKANGRKSNGERGGAGGAVAWLALLLALIVAAWNGYQWWLGQSSDVAEQGRQLVIERMQESQAGISESIQSLQTRLAAAEQRDDSGELAALNSELGIVQSRVSELGLASSDAGALIEALQTIVARLERRTTEVETGLTALAARSDTPGKRMDLAEISYLLRLASERLDLFGDARSADHALAMADAQLEALDDPLYLSVRRRIAEARDTVASVPQPDVVEISGRIAALQAKIPLLPFPGEMPVEEPVADAGEGAGIWQRIKNVLKPLVKVRRRVNQDQELTLEDKDYLRQGLWLQLESARLSLVLSDAAAWGLSLGRAEDSLRNRFATGAGTVAEALAETGRLQEVEIAGEAPDISAPWRQLQLLREGREQADEPGEAAEPVAEAPQEGSPPEPGEPAGEDEDTGG